MNDLVSAMKYTGRAVIDGGEELPCEIVIEQQMLRERTRLPRQDRAWTMVDAQGHFHAVDEDGGYPTLDRRVEHRGCDGSCGGVCQGEGYDVEAYTCTICGEDIEPGLLHGEHELTVPGLKSWRATVNGYPPPQRKLSVRFTSERVSFFGVAVVYSLMAEGYDGSAVTELVGVGKLGQVKAR